MYSVTIRRQKAKKPLIWTIDVSVFYMNQQYSAEAEMFLKINDLHRHFSLFLQNQVITKSESDCEKYTS